ncbi:MAG: RNA polymerase sigma factor [Candidatus Thorarchaeota archaeon]|jgi:RNA polymerase sigma-70 factor (ECF subfamily)
MSDSTPLSSAFGGDGRFATTHWSVVLAAGQPDSSRYQQALETLCRTYWFPLYAYLRRQGHDSHQAEEYTQAFFAQMLEKQYLSKVAPKPGKFRSFLLVALKHFLANERDRLKTQKRGGGRPVIPLDRESAENQYAIEPAHHLSADKLFEKSWALTVLDQTMNRLQNEFAGANKQKLFDRLKSYLGGEKASVPYRDVAAELEVSEGTVKVTIHRMRTRYRELLRDEIAQTVNTPEHVDEEIRNLFAALAG